MSTPILLFQITWPLDLFSGLSRIELSERLWVLTPIVVVIWFLLREYRHSRRQVVRLTQVSIDVLNKTTQSRRSRQATLIEIVFIGVIAINIAFISPFGDLSESRWMGFGTTVAALMISIFSFVIWKFRASSARQTSVTLPVTDERLSRTQREVALQVSVGVVFVCAPYLFVGFSRIPDSGHSAYVFNEMLSWLSNRPVLFESVNQYGSVLYYPIVVVDRLLNLSTSDSLFGAFVWLSILNIAFMVCFVTVVVILVSSVGDLAKIGRAWVLYLLPILSVVFMTQGSRPIQNRNEGTILNLLAAVPVRSLLPLVLLLVLLWIPSKSLMYETNRHTTGLQRLTPHLVFLVFAIFAAMNNFEFGAPLALSALVLWGISLLRLGFSRWLFPLGLFAVGVFLAILLQSESTLTGESSFSHWVAFSRGFGSGGFANLPMDRFGAHYFVIVWTYISILVGLAQLLAPSTRLTLATMRQSITLVFCGCWCLVSLVYFSGRSVASGQLQSALIPLSILLVVWSLPVVSRLLGAPPQGCRHKSWSYLRSHFRFLLLVR